MTDLPSSTAGESFARRKVWMTRRTNRKSRVECNGSGKEGIGALQSDNQRGDAAFGDYLVPVGTAPGISTWAPQQILSAHSLFTVPLHGCRPRDHPIACYAVAHRRWPRPDRRPRQLFARGSL